MFKINIIYNLHLNRDHFSRDLSTYQFNIGLFLWCSTELHMDKHFRFSLDFCLKGNNIVVNYKHLCPSTILSKL